MFDSVLIANRGEIACRVIATARAMGLRTVAVYSEPDARSVHVTSADEAIALPGSSAGETYLNAELLLDAAARTGAEAVHPGYGFLSENADFARACDDAGLVFVGPTPDVIAAMGDKIAAKSTMRALGVPVLPDAEVSEYPWAAADTVGYPLLVKAAAGGGGKGMRLVRDRADIAEAVEAARREAAGAFGDDRVFLERFVTPARHVEVQILGDAFGNLVHLGERECSVQRRHQKIIEESPSPALDEALRRQITEAGVTAARGLGYRNAGTVEFVLAPDGEFFFLEVNTRLQVEHPVTELAWRLRGGQPLDLVRLQFLVAARQPLPFSQDDVVAAGHAIEARIYAEDVAAGFLPATGTLRTWSIPHDPQVRVDGGVVAGSTVSVQYDPMLAKVIASGATRDEALAVLRATLRRSRISGVTTNREYLVRVLQHPAFRSGEYDTSFVEAHLAPSTSGPADEAMHRLHAAAAALFLARRHHLASPLPTLPAGWRNNRSQPHRVTLLRSTEEVAVEYQPADHGSWSITVDAARLDALVHRWSDEHADGELQVAFDGRRLSFAVTTDGDAVDVSSSLGTTTFQLVPRFPDLAAQDLPGGLRAPMPGSVVAVSTSVGASVSHGEVLVTIEAMKMEHRVTAPHDGTVTEVRVGVGDSVDGDDVLVVLDEPAAG